ncbi:MAG: DNA-3-methyladenine glycosylase I [Candidatus Micrarchaeota archaeon]|nr:DNA-3-methyladenine glycosylase I [Candidatus Micrarchaeota archaeon]MDE1834208.1 DNA-3-methyladenine glycosylase I [Candidatus Micrarchaeota archaeon]MDE1859921.1 DNA-3-methyladenine glycosylase I [Candidatus Micrarchaeota archaeon]
MQFDIPEPKNDNGYLDRMAHAVFESGLSWKMVENKWPNFKKAFHNFEIGKVARMDDETVKELLQNPGIVRSEGKIRAMIYNANEFQKVKKEFGSFKKYMDSFKSYNSLMKDMQERFKFLGPSNSRSFLWLAGVKLRPEPDEIAWLTKMTEKK